MTQSDAITGKDPYIAKAGEYFIEAYEKSGQLYYCIGALLSRQLAFGGGINYAPGNNPAVAAFYTDDKTTVIEVHDRDDHLYYGVGTLKNDEIGFVVFNNYDSGINPSISVIDDGLSVKIIEVHKSHGSKDNLSYNIGTLKDDNTVEWGGAKQYDTGKNPFIATYCDTQGNNKLIEVHYDNGGYLYYRLGFLEGDEIVFSDKIQYGTTKDCSQPFVVPFTIGADIHFFELHRENDDNLCHCAGALQSNNTIRWGSTAQYYKGQNPCAVVFPTAEGPDLNIIIEVHNNENGDKLGQIPGIIYREHLYIGV